MTELPEFILASKSPRRRELLEQAGYRFRVVPPMLSEPPLMAPHSSPAQVAEALAYFKACSVVARAPGQVVLGADTIVSCGDKIFGKAADAAEARSMLAAIAGTRHAVTTGLALVTPPSRRRGKPPQRHLASDTTYVTMRPLSDGEIDRYIASGEWKDKAGAYAIQETADEFIDHLDGSFTNVVGLPMDLLARLLAVVSRESAQSTE